MVAGVGLALGAMQAVEAQVPRGRRELPGHDFRSDGAWRRRTTTIREQRRSLLRAGATAALNARIGTAAPRVSGAFRLPIVLVQPSDAIAPFAPQAYQDVLFSPSPVGRPYSLNTFYAQLSNGAVSLSGTVFGWWAAPRPAAYYEDGCNGIGVSAPCAHPGANGAPSPLGEMLLGALDALNDGSVDWGQFDNDGPDGIPNSGDDDGYVDFVTFIHPAVDGACGTAHLWSHRWVLRAWHGGLPYSTKTPSARGGMILIDDYILQTGVGGSTACQSTRIMPIGTMAHETGHAFGLPDLYDTDPGPAQSEGIGEWGLMGSGNYVSPDSPARYEAWSLAEMGWVTVAPITDTRTITTNPVTQSDTVFYIPVDSRDEYFLLENRQALESDSALLNPLRGKLPGLLVWHIDNAKVQSVTVRASNTVNVGPIPGVALVESEGGNQLRLPVSNPNSNRGDAGDPFPGRIGNTRLTWTSTPRAQDNGGAYAGFVIDRIRQVVTKGALSFRVVRRGLSVIAPDHDGPMVMLNQWQGPRYEEVLAPGDQFSVSADTLHVLGDGRTGLLFRSWSNGQPRAFQLTADPNTPDTLIAHYAPAYRVQISRIRGSGNLLAPALLYRAPATAAYVAEHENLNLRAEPADGAQFLGWGGDTTASNPQLTIAGTRPYELTLDFSIASSVTVDFAALTLLQGAIGPGDPLPDAWDRDGNQDGRYDLADFLRFAASRRAATPGAVASKATSNGSASPAVPTIPRSPSAPARATPAASANASRTPAIKSRRPGDAPAGGQRQ
ncbi:MAG TPA: M6 family metalloprotease domain-containing protein [Gemmatimonadales bacterium]|nr:M6 family metalloprotease domain-containing protein [Gemmatimonadales bacterium]